MTRRACDMCLGTDCQRECEQGHCYAEEMRWRQEQQERARAFAKSVKAIGDGIERQQHENAELISALRRLVAVIHGDDLLSLDPDLAREADAADKLLAKARGESPQ